MPRSAVEDGETEKGAKGRARRRPRTLFASLCSKKALIAAFNAIGKRAGSRGVDDITVESFRHNLDQEITSVQAALKRGTFRFSALRPVAIPKKAPGEYRPLLVPTVRDRVVQRAILREIAPRIVPVTAFERSHAFRSGVGVRTAVVQLAKEMRKGKRTVLVVDIEDFFPSIDETVLFDELNAFLPDNSLRSLLGQLRAWEIGELASLPVNKRRCFPKSGTGLPQGSALSPLLSNFFLRSFDAAAERSAWAVIRYADDIAVPCETADEAKEAYGWIAGELALRGLRVPPLGSRKAGITVVGEERSKGVEYLGCYLVRRSTGVSIRPARRAIDNALRHISETLSPDTPTSLGHRYVALNHFLSSWLATYSRICNGVARERTRLLNHAETELSSLLRAKGLLPRDADLTVDQREFLGLNGIRKSRIDSLTERRKGSLKGDPQAAENRRRWEA